MKKKFWFFLLSGWAAAWPAPGGALTIVDDHASAYSIAVAADADPLRVNEAADLRSMRLSTCEALFEAG